MTDGVGVLDVPATLGVLAISLGLGGIVGLQREKDASHIAGIRTFPLITLLGTICGLIATHSMTLGVSLMVVSMVGVIAASGLGNYLRTRLWLPTAAQGDDEERAGSGITTEIAILIMYAVGVYVVFGPKLVAITVTGVVVLLLYSKQLLHKFVANLGQKDVHGIMQFVLLAFVVLPILPDAQYGPYHVLNPREIWMVVVLVVGISLGGYIAYQFVGPGAGTVLSGVLGGLISSTATAVSFARRVTGASGSVCAAAALAIMLASTVLYVRVFIQLAAVAPGAFAKMAAPIAVMGMVSLLLCGVLYLSRRGSDESVPAPENPTNLNSAFLFAGMYAAVTLAAAMGQDLLPHSGIYYVAGLAGLTATDAVTLSYGRMVTDGQLGVDQAWRAVMIGIMANAVFKTGVCGVLGGRRLFWRMALLFGVCNAVGMGIVFWWPRG